MKGYPWNHKRVYRIYRQLELNLRIKPKRRIKRDYPGELDIPAAPNQVWSMVFLRDQLVSGKSFRTFNVIDDYNREGLGIEVDLSLPASRVIRVLEQMWSVSTGPRDMNGWICMSSTALPMPSY